MTVYSKTKQHLEQYNLAPKKRFGQNFLVHQRTAESIVHSAHFSKDDTVIEVGVGLGALTGPLSDRVKKVIGLEIDSGIIRYHETEKTLGENVSLIHKDVLKSDFNELLSLAGTEKLKLIVNLPYSISNPFIFKLIENRTIVDSVTVMLQKEVAERLTAQVGTKAYGIPTVLLQSCARVEKLMTLNPAEFHPKPKIDSMVIRIIFFEPDGTYKYSTFNKVVRAAFSQRRKTLLNTLGTAQFYPDSITDKKEKKQITTTILESLGINVSARAETLSLDEFISIAKEFDRHLFS